MKFRLIRVVLTISTVVLLNAPLLTYSQEIQFQHYSSDEGFSGSAFKRMTQDSLGFIWILSMSGIIRFDGYNFEQLYDLQINGICSVDSQGDAWFGNRGKLLKFVHCRAEFDLVKLPSTSIEPTALAFSADTKVWIGTNHEGLMSFDRETDSVTFRRNLQDPKAHSINAILTDAGMLVLGTSHGLWHYDPQHDRFFRPSMMDEKLVPQLYSGNIKKIFRNGGKYWVWVDDLLLQIRPNGAIVNSLDLQKIRHQFDPNNEFSRAEFTCIAEDSDGKFWITTSGIGLILYNPSENKCINFRSDENEESSLPSDVLWDVMIDRDDNVWCATVNKGIVRLKKRSLVFHNYLKGKTTTGIEVLPTTHSRQLVVGTNGAGLWTSSFDADNLDKLSFKPFKIEGASGFENILDLEMGKSTLWVGSLNNGLIGLPITSNGLTVKTPTFRFENRKNDPSSVSQNFITTILETPDNYLWVGTISEGLSIRNLSSKANEGTFRNYKHYPSDPYSLSAGGVRFIHRENDGSMLVLMNEGVMQILNPEPPYDQLQFKSLLQNRSFIHAIQTVNRTAIIATTEGLLEAFREGDAYRFEPLPLPGKPHVVAIEEDALGRIWCMSFQGLFFYDPKTKFVLQFTKEDGLPSSSAVSAGHATQTEEGVMIFSNTEGMIVFDPLTLKINSSKPKPVLTSLKINNERIIPRGSNTSGIDVLESIVTLKNLELDYTHNILELEFSAMDMTSPEKNRYQYRLEGFSDTWIEIDWRDRKAVYTNLAAGKYTFYVKASNRDGVWSDHVASLDIVVLPAPWNTWWAYTLYVFIILAALYYSRQSLLKEERLKASLRIEQVELEKKQMELVKAQEIDRLKSSFFTNISHEFRTPLTLIQGPVQLLLEKFASDAKVKHQLNLVQNNVQLLLKLINQLLELSRLESGNVTVENKPTDLNLFVSSVLDYFETQGKQKKLSVHVDLPPVSYQVSMDNGKMETILINLIGNAMKFTPDHGKVFVKVWFEEIAHLKDGKSKTLCVLVGDNGIGIPEDKHELIFDRFYQVSETHHHMGTGIGLALVRELTQWIGGNIELKSKPDVGSEFTVKIPVEVLTWTVKEHLDLIEDKNDDEKMAELNGHSQNNLNVPKILVVEDNHDLRQFIIDSFDGAYHFLEASNGKEGLDKAVHEIPEIIISDIMMPEMDGITMSAKIKKDIRTCHIPLLFLTAKATEKSKLNGLETGAEDYLTKPFSKDELILKVRNIISGRDKIRERLRLELLNEAPSLVAQSSDELFLIKVKEAIHSRLNDPKLGVDTLALDVGLSRTQLYRKINALTGFTVNELIRTFRLKKAAHLIDQNWGGVSEVAYEVGFSNLSYFSKCFKEHFGVLPSSYHQPKHS